MGTQEVVESYLRNFPTLREIAEQTRSSAKSRLVWFVAIAGFVILNGKQIWDPIAEVRFTGVPLALLALPWAFAALIAVIAHFIIDEAGVKDDTYYLVKLSTIELHLERIKHGDDDPAEMLQIVNDTHTDISGPWKTSNRWGTRAMWLERITFILIAFGVLWALIGPFILACYIK